MKCFPTRHVQSVYNNSQKCYLNHDFPPNMIWNLDETERSTVASAPKIVAQTGAKRVGQIN